VSEIMLQQTRVEAVIPYYLAWMKSFPTVYDLANASEEEVNAHWAGLGFYRRAKYLHKGAKYVVDVLDGIIPESVDELIQINGIGRYTASAISSIAFNKCVPVVDGNVCRVLARLKGIANNIKSPVLKDKLGWKLAAQIVQAGDGKDAGEVNQALMELGATYCAPTGSGVDDNDPLVNYYLSTKIGRELCKVVNSNIDINDYIASISKKRKHTNCCLCDHEGISTVLIQVAEELKKSDNVSSTNAAIAAHRNLPLKPLKISKREEVLVVLALKTGEETEIDQRWLMVKRPDKGLLAGQWEFPNSCVWVSASNVDGRKYKTVADIPFIDGEKRQSAAGSLLRDFFSTNDELVRSLECQWLEKMTHVFSHVRHTMYVQHGVLPSSQYDTAFNKSFFGTDRRERRWMNESDMKSVGITSGVKKVLVAVKEVGQKSHNFLSS